MKLNKRYQPLLALLFLLSMCQVVFGADNEVGESDALCHPHQATTLSLPPLPEGYPICDGAIEPTDRAFFDADMGKVILPAVRVNQKEDYVYSLELSLLSAADDPTLTFEMTHYCLIQEPTSLPRHAEIATLTLPPGKIRIPAIDIGGITYSASLDVEQPSTQVWEEKEIFTRKQERVIFKVPQREVRQKPDKPKYPVLFVHGLNSGGTTWESYYENETCRGLWPFSSCSYENDKEHWWKDKRLTYGGNIYIRDKYHLFEPGENANQNPDDDKYNQLRRRIRSDDLSSFFQIKVVKKDEKGSYVCCKDKQKDCKSCKKGEVKADFYTMNFSNNKDISFAAQGLELKAVVNKIVDWTEKEGVYVVAHSMGGLATRAYLQYFNDNKVKGLITVGTPHKGSRESFWGTIGNAFAPGDIVEQLKPNSIDLKMLNKDCSPNMERKCLLLIPPDVKYLFVVVKGKDSLLVGETDGIVPTDSQWIKDIGEKTVPTVDIPEILAHIYETSNSDIEQIVWDKLIEWSKD